tara:strand:+ start:538 stop:726 length:189 start_codon:yes stop_codon:yes gene_type:complete
VREQRRINTQEIKDACERFLEKRGEKQPTFRDMVNKAAKRGKRRSAAQNKIEQAAQELENED